MDIQGVASSLLCSSTLSSSSSLSSRSNWHPLSIGTRSLLVGDKTTRWIMVVLQPTIYFEYRRKEVIEYLQLLIEGLFGFKVRVVKCTVRDIAVDISFDQSVYAPNFLEKVNQFIGEGHLFKLSIILIKSWCYYESRLLGGFYGLISSHALEIMVLHVINHFHSSLHSPLAVLYTFLDYYSKFGWKKHDSAFNGLVILSSLPKLFVAVLPDGAKLLLTKEFLWRSKDMLLHTIGVNGSKITSFQAKFLDILDPLKKDNNLGRNVSSKGYLPFLMVLKG